MYLNFKDPKTRIFRDFRVFLLSPIPKNENSEIMEIHQKPQILKDENKISKTLEILFK